MSRSDCQSSAPRWIMALPWISRAPARPITAACSKRSGSRHKWRRTSANTVHKAKKRFGQNFLVDERIIGDIIGAIRPEPSDNMVEIGPGLGALTRPLLKRLNHLHVVEIDRDIIARLENDYPQHNPP